MTELEKEKEYIKEYIGRIYSTPKDRTLIVNNITLGVDELARLLSDFTNNHGDTENKLPSDADIQIEINRLKDSIVLNGNSPETVFWKGTRFVKDFIKNNRL